MWMQTHRDGRTSETLDPLWKGPVCFSLPLWDLQRRWTQHSYKQYQKQWINITTLLKELLVCEYTMLANSLEKTLGVTAVGSLEHHLQGKPWALRYWTLAENQHLTRDWVREKGSQIDLSSSRRTNQMLTQTHTMRGWRRPSLMVRDSYTLWYGLTLRRPKSNMVRFVGSAIIYYNL